MITEEQVREFIKKDIEKKQADQEEFSDTEIVVQNDEIYDYEAF